MLRVPVRIVSLLVLSLFAFTGITTAVAPEAAAYEWSRELEEGDTDTAPYGLGTYASRSTPVARSRSCAPAGATS